MLTPDARDQLAAFDDYCETTAMQLCTQIDDGGHPTVETGDVLIELLTTTRVLCRLVREHLSDEGDPDA